MTDKPDARAGIASAKLADDNPIAATFDDQDVVLVRHGGTVCALAGTCTHLKAPMADGLVVGDELRCPWHHARFSLTTGEAVGAPAFAPLRRFTVVEEDGAVRVTGEEKADAAPPPRARELGRIVIVGAGAGGHACADLLARRGAGDAVTLLTSEPDAPYDRTFVSKQYLAGDATRDEAMLPAPGEVAGRPIAVRTGVTVTALDLAERAVVTGDGERIAYDTLILATGAEPVGPDFAGSDRPDVHRLRTLADANALIAAAADGDAAIVIGSSYIGLEVAASLRQRGLGVTVIGDAAVPLAKTAGPEVGRMVQGLHEDKGVVFNLDREVREWDGTTATLDDGSTVAGAFVVLGTGVAPRVELARAAGLDLADDDAGGGVAVDRTLRTSDPYVYAIGDIASVPDPRLGHAIRVEHWVVAQRMGQWLARHLLGEGPDAYGEPPFFWSGHYDTQLRYVGHVASPDDRRIDGDPDDADVAVTFREQGVDQALLTIGRDRAALERGAAWAQ